MIEFTPARTETTNIDKVEVRIYQVRRDGRDIGQLAVREDDYRIYGVRINGPLPDDLSVDAAVDHVIGAAVEQKVALDAESPTPTLIDPAAPERALATRVEVHADTPEGVATGRNGDFDMGAVTFWTTHGDRAYIDFISAKTRKKVRAGCGLPAEALDEICLAWLRARGVLPAL